MTDPVKEADPQTPVAEVFAPSTWLTPGPKRDRAEYFRQYRAAKAKLKAEFGGAVAPLRASRPKRPVPKVAEKAFQQVVLDFAKLNGWRSYFTHNSCRSPPGFPDLTMVRGDRLLFAELKTETGVASVDQAQWMLALTEVPSVEGYFWRPSDWPEIEQALKR